MLMHPLRWFYGTAILIVIAGTGHAQTFSLSDAVETGGSGSINWTSGEVFATGIGAPPANASNPAQARAMAERAAQVVAYRNLLETVKGVRVDSETVVENFITKSDIIKTRVNGIVRGARIVKKQYMSDGAVEVVLAMSLKGALLDAVVPEDFGSSSITPIPLTPAPTRLPEPRTPPKAPEPARPVPSQPTPVKPAEPAKPEPVRPAPPQPQPVKPAEPPRTEPARPAQPAPQAPSDAAAASTTQFKGGKPTGVVIDARGLGLRPALLPKIIDPQGQELYVGQVVTRTNAVEQGVAGYAKDVNAAANNFRVTDNPVIVLGLRAAGAVRTDIVLNQADAQALRELSRKGDFLQYCRVIIVY